ncbi:MAG: hypothetical protein ABW061_00125, partial [Polyangiaceae bacterium]
MPAPPSLSPVVDYHGLGHCHLESLGLLMRPQLNGGTLGGRAMNLRRQSDDVIVRELLPWDVELFRSLRLQALDRK